MSKRVNAFCDFRDFVKLFRLRSLEKQMRNFKKQASAVLSSVALFCPLVLLSQSGQWEWKEYVYPNDGFAITFPFAPVPRRDPKNVHMNTYTIHFTADSGVTLRVDDEKRDCATTLNSLKDGALHNKQPEQPINPSSVKDVSLGEYPGLEYEFRFDPEFTVYDRFLCVNGRFYNFTAKWATKQPRPAAMTRIIGSFRILKTKSPK